MTRQRGPSKPSHVISGRQAGTFLAEMGAAMAPGSGLLEASGKYYSPSQGQQVPGLLENFSEGNYGTAAMQGVGLLGDALQFGGPVGLAIGGVMKAPKGVVRGVRAARGIDWSAFTEEPRILFHNTDEVQGFDVSKDVGFGGIFAGPKGGMEGSRHHAVLLDPNDIMDHSTFSYRVPYDDYADAIRKELPGASDSDVENLWEFVAEENTDMDDLLSRVDYDRLFRGRPMAEESPGWAIQALRGRIANRLGYKAATMHDETGTSVFVGPGVRTIPLEEGETLNDAEVRLYEAWKKATGK